MSNQKAGGLMRSARCVHVRHNYLSNIARYPDSCIGFYVLCASVLSSKGKLELPDEIKSACTTDFKITAIYLKISPNTHLALNLHFFRLVFATLWQFQFAVWGCLSQGSRGRKHDTRTTNGCIRVLDGVSAMVSWISSIKYDCPEVLSVRDSGELLNNTF